MADQPREPDAPDSGEVRSAARRRALVRLGLAVGAAYVAPSVLSIDRRAWAMGLSCAKNSKNC